MMGTAGSSRTVDGHPSCTLIVPRQSQDYCFYTLIRIENLLDTFFAIHLTLFVFQKLKYHYVNQSYFMLQDDTKR